MFGLGMIELLVLLLVVGAVLAALVALIVVGVVLAARRRGGA